VAEQIRDRIAGDRDIGGLLSLPQVLSELLEACIGGESAQPLAEIALQDAALSAKILLAASKTAERPLDANEPVSSAIQQLGVPIVTGIALQAARQVIQQQLDAEELTFQYELWFLSRSAGLAARCLAPSIGYSSIEEAQLSGLLLNLGIQALFMRHRREYLDSGALPWSSSSQCQWEHTQYRTDHLQLADSLIEQWQLDSFLADAARFLHADLGQIAQSSRLLQIARWAQQFCCSPHQLTAETEYLGQQLFGLKESETKHLFAWTCGLYPAYGKFLQDPAQLEADFTAAVARLTQLLFALADQEAARARLSVAESPPELARIARSLFLENSAATEVLFFLVDGRKRHLRGVPGNGQSRMLAEIEIPLVADAGLAADALLHGRQRHSLDPPQPLTVSDQLLSRLCRGGHFVCQPLRVQGRPLGVVVFGIRTQADLDSLQSMQLKMFAHVASGALERLLAAGRDGLALGGNPLRRLSQEINNPLTVISNSVGVLQQAVADEEGRKLTRLIKQQARRIDEVIGYYLNLQGLPDFPLHRIDLNSLLRETAERFSPTELEAAGIELQLALKNNLEEVATNPVTVQQIVTGLLEKAVANLGEGGCIQLQSRESYIAGRGQHVEIAVSENGPELSRAAQAEMFQTADEDGQGASVPEGLSRIRAMVEDLGGQLSCHSSSDAGTSFLVQIPCRVEAFA
jgi:signal transduction histidine kinase/HD-like signal output (HDOD) protein